MQNKDVNICMHTYIVTHRELKYTCIGYIHIVRY